MYIRRLPESSLFHLGTFCFSKLLLIKQTMASLSKLTILFFFFQFISLAPLLFSILNPSLHLKESAVTDIHDLLPNYNLPKGLLPGNIKSYDLFPQDDTFRVELTHHCYVHFQDQVAFYDTVITGKLSYGKVSEVSGIQAKKLFLWVSVTGMEVDEKSNMIEFHAGVFTQEMPAEAFQSIPICHQKGLQDSGVASI